MHTNTLQNNQNRASARLQISAVRACQLWSLTYVALSIIWPRYGHYSIGPLPNVTPFTLMGILSWAIFPLFILLSPEIRVGIQRQALGKGILIILISAWYVWRFISSISGETPDHSTLITMREIIYYIPIIPAALIATSTLQGAKDLAKIIAIFTAAAIALAILEQVTSRPVTDVLGLKFAIDAQSALNVTEVTFRGGFARVKSIFSHPIVFGQFIAWSSPIIFCLALGRGNALGRFLAMTTAIAGAWAAYNTGSRAGLIGYILSVGIFFSLYILRKSNPRTRKGALVAIALVTAAAFAITFGTSNLAAIVAGRNATEVGSASYRSAMLEKAGNEISSSPIVGFGDGRAAYHAGFRGRNNILTIDSYYLTSLLDSGWVGLALLLGILSGALALLTGRILSAEGTYMDAANLAGLISLVVTFSIVSISDNLTLLLLSIALCSPSKSKRGRLGVT